MYYSPVFSLSFICPTEYGFLFSLGTLGVEHLDAQLIMSIQRMMLKSQTPSAIQNQSNFQPKKKCIASKIHAGIVHSRLINILKSRQAKNSLILFIDRSHFRLIMPRDLPIWACGYREAGTVPTKAIGRHPSFSSVPLWVYLLRNFL